MKIKYHGVLPHVPEAILEHANTIKLENYKTNTPTAFQKHQPDNIEFTKQLAKAIDYPPASIDWVYFSVCKGAKTHVDELGDKFTDTTFVIPIIVPKGRSTITAEYESMSVRCRGIYEFNHNKEHSMELEDTESGCVVIMAAIRSKQ